MCVDHTMNCKCGGGSASFNFKDEIMPAEIVNNLYCPKCSGDVAFEPDSMLKDNSWIIDFDMEVARFMGQRLPSSSINPEYLFDEGYCTWRGVYPNDHVDSVRERAELVKLAKINQKKYFEEFKKWGVERMSRLEKEGWRKARETN
ncbi:MAG: hypothetical protein C0402_03940 [Thermodesulfovibrio sp.]|nr:hypothetical protein [Thermodesulfovibrio sp.]